MKVTRDLYHTAVAVGNEIIAYSASSDFVTIGTDFTDYDDKWTIQISRSLSTGAPTLSIESSDDNTNWKVYTGYATAVSVTNGELLYYPAYQFKYMRVSYKAVGATGTITMKLTTRQTTNR